MMNARRFVRTVVERRTTPCVIDADGLNSLAPWLFITKRFIGTR